RHDLGPELQCVAGWLFQRYRISALRLLKGTRRVLLSLRKIFDQCTLVRRAAAYSGYTAPAFRPLTQIAAAPSHILRDPTFFCTIVQLGRQPPGQSDALLMNALDLIKLAPLMARTSGSPAVKIGLIDGPVAIRHPDLTVENLREIRGSSKSAASCRQPDSIACLHGTFVSRILSARRGSTAPAICPGCTLLVRSIFAESNSPGS